MNIGVDRVWKARLQTLQRQYELLAMGEEESIRDFVARMTKIVNDIRNSGENLDEGE